MFLCSIQSKRPSGYVTSLVTYNSFHNSITANYVLVAAEYNGIIVAIKIAPLYTDLLAKCSCSYLVYD